MKALFPIAIAAALECAAASSTGFFHLETRGGADWAVGPDGRAMTLAGVDFVNPDVFYSTFLGYAPYARFVETNYPSRLAWAEETSARLSSWGFNVLASHCATSLFPGFPHADTLNLNNPFAKSKDPEWRIAENRDAPSTGFPNVFHPDYEKAVFAAAAKRCAPLKDDPSLVGWFIDNELNWWGGAADIGTGLFDLCAKLPPEHSARKALEEWLESNRLQTTAIECKRRQSTASAVPREVKIGFLRLIAERYFSINAAAIRAADPNHLVLGCRFARGTAGAHEVVWREAGRHCDAVSLNCYAWCDLDKYEVFADQGGPPLLDELRRVHGYCGRPMLITEWSFPALDTGRPCLHGAGQRFRTQAERAEAVELFASTVLSEPYILGHNWFMWVDQPAVGLRPALLEDSNYGLVSEDGKPYALVTEAFARVHAGAAALRAGGWTNLRGGAKCPAAAPGESERARFFAAAGAMQGGASTPPPAVGFARFPDGSWSLSNGLVRISGRVGGAFMADEIAFRPVAEAGALVSVGPNSRPVAEAGALVSVGPNSRPVAEAGALVPVGSNSRPVAEAAASAWRPAGRFRTLLQRGDATRRIWTDADRVTDVSFAIDGETGVGTVTIRSEAGTADNSADTDAGAPVSESMFAMTARLSLAPCCREILAEIESIENLSPGTLDVQRVFMRPYAAEERPGVVPSVPKLWRGPHEGWWELADGRRFGAVSRDRSSCSFRFYVGGNGVQHPDAPFVEDGPFEIGPGATWRPSSPMGARLVSIEEGFGGNR